MRKCECALLLSSHASSTIRVMHVHERDDFAQNGQRPVLDKSHRRGSIAWRVLNLTSYLTDRPRRQRHTDARGRALGPPSMENRSTTLVLCAALASASRRPLQIRDLQVYVRLASHDKGVPSWVRQVAWHDASGIFTILHDLEATGQVRRENKGYVLTRPGRVCADNLLRELPPAEAEALNRVAADAARTAA